MINLKFMPHSNKKAPQFWCQSVDQSGALVLTYAVRGGGAWLSMVAMGIGLICAAVWGLSWLAAGGLTGAGWAFAVLVPGCALLFGCWTLDRLLWAREEYTLGAVLLSARRRSFFGNRRTEIPLGAIRAILQQYTPPPAGAGTTHQGEWVTFVQWQRPDGTLNDFALDGLHSREERQWLAPLLTTWAGVEKLEVGIDE